jgi:hypothetical protein
MMKRIGRRLVSLLLTFVTVLTMLPAMTLPALAASGNLTGLTDQNIGLRYDGSKNVVWKVEDETITGSAKSYDGWVGYTTYESNLTITNNRKTSATLFFDYDVVVNGGTINVGDQLSVTKGDTFSTELAAGGSITVYIKSGENTEGTNITMSKILLVHVVDATVTFQPAENGSYTVDERAINESWSNTQSSTTAYQVVATPAKGYQFRDWYNVTTGKTISKKSSCALNVDENCDITARFVPDNTATFEAGDKTFIALDEAIEYANTKAIKKITVIKDGILLQGDYTIPAGMTLLIPYDAAGTVSNGEPKLTKEYATPSTFRELTMTEGSTLTVNGELVVGGVLSAKGQGDGFNGTPSGPHGAIIMPEGSAIIVNGKLYAYGYISGPKDSTGKYTSGFNCGTVTVNSGGEVHEAFQIKDFRGGSATTTLLDNKERVFLFSQYFVQNIEVPLTIYKGAHDYAYSGVQVSYGIGTYVAKTGKVSFIGNGGLFNVTDGYITRTYVAKAPEGSALLNDHVYYDVHGSIVMNSITLKISGKSVNAAKYDLPINGNLSLRLFENESGGSKAVVNTPLAFLPGFELYISKNSELTAAAPMYVYDAAEWNKQYVNSTNYNKGNPVLTYTKASKGTTPKQVPSAQIDVNGTLTTSTGGVYTTASGANICSSEGTGRFIQTGAPGTGSNTYQCTQANKDITYVSIPITPAKLKNADGKYTETKDAVANDTFIYCKCQDCGNGTWVKDVAAIINNGTQGDTYSTLEAAVNAYSPDSNTAPTNYIKLLHNTTEKPISVNNKSLRLDLNGRTVTGDISVTSGYKLYGMDNSSKEYIAPSGKIVGTVTGTVAPTYQTPPTVDGEYDRYVAIQGKEADNETANLSFHRFNISVTGYRFELATGDTPQCALFFIGKFQGDKAAKDYLKSLGFTLTDIDGKTTNPRYEIPADTDIPPMPTGGGASDSEVVLSDDGAYFFEAYLMRDINKKDSATYQTPFTATAQAMFKNNGTQDSEPKQWSFEDAWKNPGELDTAQQKILENFLKELGINQ